MLLFAVLHFLPDSEDPHACVRVLARALPPGSALVVSHITGKEIGEERSRAAQQV